MQVMESYGAKPMAASGQLLGLKGGNIGGFLCTVAGSVKLDASQDGSGAVIVNTIPVVAGTFYPMPFAFGTGAGVYATLAGGAQGTFAIN